jgi:antitoxin component of MazEF toxin-antitoxin module
MRFVIVEDHFMIRELLKKLCLEEPGAEVAADVGNGRSIAVSHLFERRSVAAGHEILAEALNQNLGRQELSRMKYCGPLNDDYDIKDDEE